MWLMARRALALLASLFGLWTATHPSSAGEMPKDFVYLRDIDPTIQQDMRYAGSGNFTGAQVNGYRRRRMRAGAPGRGSAEGGPG